MPPPQRSSIRAQLHRRVVIGILPKTAARLAARGLTSAACCAHVPLRWSGLDAATEGHLRDASGCLPRTEPAAGVPERHIVPAASPESPGGTKEAIRLAG